MKTLIKYIIVLFLIVFSFNQKVLAQEKIKIGLIVPLSGEYKEIGDSIIKSIRLAINKIKRLGQTCNWKTIWSISSILTRRDGSNGMVRSS